MTFDTCAGRKSVTSHTHRWTRRFLHNLSSTELGSNNNNKCQTRQYAIIGLLQTCSSVCLTWQHAIRIAARGRGLGGEERFVCRVKQAFRGDLFITLKNTKKCVSLDDGSGMRTIWINWPKLCKCNAFYPGIWCELRDYSESEFLCPLRHWQKHA